MSNTVTLGGERVGSGNKMKVELHGFERSTHDLSYLWRSTMSAGTLVPFMKVLALPGDTFDIDLQCDVKTHPTIGPLFGSFKVQLDVYEAPIRLYHSALHNNALGIGMKMNQIKFPVFDFLVRSLEGNVDLDNIATNPSSLLAYLGIRGPGICVASENETEARLMNAIPLLAYWEIYKNYYANKQEEVGYYIAKQQNYTYDIPTGPVKIKSTNINGQVFETEIPWEGSGTELAGFAMRGSLFFDNATADYPPEDVVVRFWDGSSATFEQITGGVYTVKFISPASVWRFEGQVIDAYREKQPKYFGWPNTAEAVAVKPKLRKFDLANIDKQRELILASPPLAQYRLNTNNGLQPYDCNYTWWKPAADASFIGAQWTQQGLGIKTYQSDLFNNWLSTEWITGVDGINAITAVDTSQGYFNIDALNLSKKVYDMLNRIAVSGGSYGDWLNAVYDHDSFGKPESPIYCGGLSKELVFQEVVSNSESAEGQPLGTLAGKGVMGHKHKGGKVVIKVHEPSYIIGIISITPRIDYSQGNDWDVTLETMDDLHKPSLDQIGFQDLVAEQMAWWTTYKNQGVNTYSYLSPGKQPAWMNYMTAVNVVRGNFAIADNEMFMVLTRRYEPSIGGDGLADIKDMTTYIDPSKYNHIFANTSLDAQNFWTQISVDMIARRKMSAKVMPNL